MPPIICPACGKAMLVPREVPRLDTDFEGVAIVVPGARFSECPACGERVYGAKELTRLKHIRETTLLQAGVLPAGSDVKRIRESLGLSVMQFADLIAVTRQTVHLWERNAEQPMKFGPAALVVSLLDPQKSERASEFAASLMRFAAARGRSVAIEHKSTAGSPVVEAGQNGALKPSSPHGGPCWKKLAA